LYGGSQRGPLKSTDGGATWSVIDQGMRDIVLAYGFDLGGGVLAIDPLTPSTIYASAATGLFKSVDGGANWTPTGLFQHLPLASLSAVTVNPLGVAYGASSTGTVTLVRSAPAGGVTVALSSSVPS